MKRNTYKQMLVESLIDISSMQNYKTPADKVLNAKDEKYETFRSATSEVDVLGRAYAGQDDWDNTFITETADMDEENVAQGEPEVKVELPDGHDPDVTDLEDNIDESDPDKEYQEPITSEKDASEEHLHEDAEEPVEDGEEEEEEDQFDEGTVTEPSDAVPTEEELQNADPEIATESDDLGGDLPEDEPFEKEPAAEGDIPETDGEDLGEDLPEDEPVAEEEFDEPVMDPNDDFGEDLPEDDEDIDTDEDVSDFQNEDDGVELETEENPEEFEKDDEIIDDELPGKDDVITDEESDIDSKTTPEDVGEVHEASYDANGNRKTGMVGNMTKGALAGAAVGTALGGPLGGALGIKAGSALAGLGALGGAKIGMAAGAAKGMIDEGSEDLGDDLPEDEPFGEETADDNPEAVYDPDEEYISDELPEDEPISDETMDDEETDELEEDPDPTYSDEVSESLLEADVTMDPNAGAMPPPPAAPAAPVPPAPPAAAPAMDPNAGAMPMDPNAVDPNAAPMDPTMDPNAEIGGAVNPEEQDPILDVDSNVVASDTTQGQEGDEEVAMNADPNAAPTDPNTQDGMPADPAMTQAPAAPSTPMPTSESVMESLITELGSYSDNGTADIKDLLEQDIDD